MRKHLDKILYWNNLRYILQHQREGIRYKKLTFPLNILRVLSEIITGIYVHIM